MQPFKQVHHLKTFVLPVLVVTLMLFFYQIKLHLKKDIKSRRHHLKAWLTPKKPVHSHAPLWLHNKNTLALVSSNSLMAFPSRKFFNHSAFSISLAHMLCAYICVWVFTERGASRMEPISNCCACINIDHAAIHNTWLVNRVGIFDP